MEYQQPLGRHLRARQAATAAPYGPVLASCSEQANGFQSTATAVAPRIAVQVTEVVAEWQAEGQLIC